MSEAEIVNLTPHTIRIYLDSTQVVTLPTSGEIARLPTFQIETDPLGLIPVVRTVYGKIEGLPEPKPGVVYVVSSLVARAAKREDVLAPDTGITALKDPSGRIKGVIRLQAFV